MKLQPYTLVPVSRHSVICVDEKKMTIEEFLTSERSKENPSGLFLESDVIDRYSSRSSPNVMLDDWSLHSPLFS